MKATVWFEYEMNALVCCTAWKNAEMFCNF